MTPNRIKCRLCSKGISEEDINVPEGVAYCRACHSLSKLADLAEDAQWLDVEESECPNGCEIIDEGARVIVRASTQSWKSASGMLFAAFFCNAIVSVFVLQAMSVSYHHVFGQNATWLPKPNWTGYPNGVPPVWFAIGLWVFLLPFVSVCLILIWSFLTSMAGKVEVRIGDADGLILVGCGPLMWKRRFDASAVQSVTLGQTTWAQNGQTKPVIVIDCGRNIRLGSILPGDRLVWMAAALRKLLVTRAIT